MKKKLFVTAAVCALSAACVFGATACGGGDGNQGRVHDVGPSIQVESAQEWLEAIEKTNAATNYTASVYMEVTTIDKGVTFTNADIVTGYRVDNEQYALINRKSNDTEIKSCVYSLSEEPYMYTATLVEGDSDWEVVRDIRGYAPFIVDEYDFSEFTYENGKYITKESSGRPNVSIKINSEGYISYVSQQFEHDGVSYLMEQAVYNYGSTTYNFPADAKQAVEDYKAENN